MHCEHLGWSFIDYLRLDLALGMMFENKMAVHSLFPSKQNQAFEFLSKQYMSR